MLISSFQLIQLAVEKGPSDEYTNEMVEWWLPEPGLDYKLYEVREISLDQLD